MTSKPQTGPITPETDIPRAVAGQLEAITETAGIETDRNDWLTAVNQAITTGNHNLRDFAGDQTRIAIIRRARADLIQLLDLDLDKIKRETPNLPKPERLIGHFQLFDDLGLDYRQIINRYPRIVSLNPDNIIAKADHLETMGLDPARVIGRDPSILGFSKANISETAGYLEQFGLKSLKIISQMPRIVGWSQATTADKLRQIESWAADPIKVLNRNPQIFGISNRSIRASFSCLESLNLEPPKIIEHNPQIIGLSTALIEAKVELLKNLGIDPVKAINQSPIILSLSQANITAKFDRLKESGLDPVRVIERNSSVLSLSQANIDAKINCLTGLGLDPVKVINRVPKVLSLSARNITGKVLMVRKAVKLFDCDYPAENLIEAQPILLSFSRKRLRVLRELLARYVAAESRTDLPHTSTFILTLESYIIALEDCQKTPVSLNDLVNRAKNINHLYDAGARKQRAISIVTAADKRLDERICRLYLDYIGYPIADSGSNPSTP